jgi:phosphate-selective porin OprO/OprP
VYASFKDGITLMDQGGDWKLAVNGRVQADYRHFHPDVEAADTFSVRRARLGATLNFYRDYTARIEGEYSAVNTVLTYAYIDINKFHSARLRLGQFKPYYGLERAMSTNFTDFQERSLADVANTFDRGLMLFGSPATGFNYSIAYINGTGTADENDAINDGKDITARATLNMAEAQGWSDSVVHLGGFIADGEESSRRRSGFIPAAITEGRGLTFFTTSCSAAACGNTLANAFSEDVDRKRAGLELALAHGPLRFQSEYIGTAYKGPGYTRDINGWYGSMVWNVTGESFASMYRDGMFGRLRPLQDFEDGEKGWGGLQLGLRYSKFDASGFKANNPAGTGVLLNNPAGTADGLLVAASEAHAWTFGANWILNPNVRIVTNWVHTDYETPVLVRVDGRNKSLEDEDVLTMRAQFDF